MSAAIVEGDPDIDDRVAGQYALMPRLHDALFHSRDEVPGHRTTHDLVREFEPGASRQRLHPYQNMPVLPMPTGLLLMLVLGVDQCSDGLPVGNPGNFQVNPNTKLALHALSQYINVRI